MAALLGVAGALGGPPAYRALKTWRAHGLVAQANRLLAAGRAPEAVRLAQAAYQLSPRDDQTIRVLAQLYASEGQRDALVLWQNLVAAGKATAADRRALATFALAIQAWDTAAEQLRWLLRQAPADLANLELATQFYFQRGELAQAERFCQQALARQPENRGLRLLLARLLAESGDPGEAAQARLTIRTLAAGEDAVGLEGLTALAAMPELPEAAADWVADRLEHHPLATAADHLLAAGLRIHWHPEQRQSLITQASARYGDGSDVERLVLARWLNALGDYTQTLACLPPAVALKSQDLCLVRLDALAALGRWQDIRQTLDDRHCPLEAVLNHLFHARVAEELGRKEEAKLAWSRVQMTATDRPLTWLYVAQYAERLGDVAQAAKAWRRLTHDPSFNRIAYRALIRLGEREGNTRALRALMREIAQQFPSDPEPRNDLAYLDLLLNDDAAGAETVAAQLVHDHPNYLAYRTTLALARLRHNQAAAAAALYRGLELDWGGVLPGWQAVRAAVLGANGETNLARVACRRIPLERLKPEERALIQSYL